MKNQIELLYDMCKILKLVTDNYNYEIKTRLKKRNYTADTTIYSNTHDKNTTAIIYLSGAGTLQLSFYIKKTIDLLHDKKRDLFVYENKNTLSWCCIDSIIDWVKCDLLSKYTHIVFVGFSNGGIISSHVLYTLTRLKTDVKFKMITVDTTNSLNKLFEFYEDNFTYYRNDVLMCYIPTVVNLLIKQNKKVLLNDLLIKDYKTFELFIERVYGIKQQYMRTLNSITYDLPNCNVFRIYSNDDPVVLHKLSKDVPLTHVKYILFDKLTHTVQMFSHPTKFTKLMNSILKKENY